MPARFNRLGISFQYPDNWTLDDTDAMLGRHSVTVFSPGGAFWSVTVQSASVDPEELIDAAVEAMKQEYEELEAADVCENIAGHELSGKNLAFYYLDLTNTAQIRSLQIAQSVYTIFCQGEDREFDRVENVFKAMTMSLLTETPHEPD